MDNTLKIALGGIAAALVAAFFLLMGHTEHSAFGGANSPDFNIGSVRLYSQQSSAFNQATNTVLCSLLSPAGTSTLLSAGFVITTPTSSATYLGISKAQTATGSVAATGINLLASTTIASGALGATAASSTLGAVIPPSTYLNFSQTNGGIMNQAGSCSAVWQVL